MTISNVITILLFILPGVLAEKISYRIDSPSKESASDLNTTINGLLMSLPILLINGFIYVWSDNIETFKKFTESFNNILFSLSFIISTLFLAIVFGVVKGVTKDIRIKTLNWIRHKNYKMPVDERSCWQKFLTDKNEARYIEVIIDGKSYKGFANDYSLTNDDAAVVLNIDKVLYEYIDCDLEKLFTKVIGTYIDVNKNVVIKDYDMTEYNKWVDEKFSKSLAKVEA